MQDLSGAFLARVARTSATGHAARAQGMALLCMSRPVEDCTVETQSDWGYSLGVGEWKGATGHILGREIDPLMEESAR